MRLGLALATSAAALAIGGGAAAATLFYDPGGPYSEMLHNNSFPSGTTVSLLSQPGGALVDFTGDALLDPSGAGNGFAQVEGPFSWILIDPEDPLAGFTRIGFTLNPQNKFDGHRLSDYAFNIDVNYVGGGTQTFSAVAPSFGKYDIWAQNDEVISSIRIYGLTGEYSGGQASGLTFDDIRHISFDTAVAGVPEPATWAMLLFGVFSVGAALRLARRQAPLGAG
jgi:hypothetical protein